MKKTFLVRAEEEFFRQWRRAAKIEGARSLNAWIVAAAVRAANAVARKGGGR